MAGFSDFLEDALLDHVFNGVAFSSPSTIVYVSLYTEDPSDAGGGTELTSAATSYVRVLHTAWTSASSGAIENSSAITFATAGGAWGSVIAAGVHDASGGGNLLGWCQLDTHRDIAEDDIPRFATGELDITLD